MAGIGFRLRSLSEQENLLAPVASIVHAAIIAAGPWIFTVVALALVDRFTSSTVPIAVLDSSRLLIIYAFALSLLGTSPIVIVATRLVGDAIYARSFDRIRSIFLAALLLAGGAAALAALVTYRLIFAVPDRLLIAGVGLLRPGGPDLGCDGILRRSAGFSRDNARIPGGTCCCRGRDHWRCAHNCQRCRNELGV